MFMLQQTTGPPSKLVPGMKTPVQGSPAAHHSIGHKSCPRVRTHDFMNKVCQAWGALRHTGRPLLPQGTQTPSPLMPAGEKLQTGMPSSSTHAKSRRPPHSAHVTQRCRCLLPSSDHEWLAPISTQHEHRPWINNLVWPAGWKAHRRTRHRWRRGRSRCRRCPRRTPHHHPCCRARQGPAGAVQQLQSEAVSNQASTLQRSPHAYLLR